jgi:hypothetical protein
MAEAADAMGVSELREEDAGGGFAPFFPGDADGVAAGQRPHGHLDDEREPAPDPRESFEDPPTMMERVGLDEHDPSLLDNPNSVSARIGRAPGELVDGVEETAPDPGGPLDDGIDLLEDQGLDELLNDEPLDTEEE